MSIFAGKYISYSMTFKNSSFSTPLGCCEVILSDQGGEFVNAVQQELFQCTGTKHKVSSAYHSQTDGLTE